MAGGQSGLDQYEIIWGYVEKMMVFAIFCAAKIKYTALYLVWRKAVEKEAKQADRPDSVTAPSLAVGTMTVIHLGAGLLRRSSFLPARSASRINACLFGIAPGGGYRVSP